MGGTTAVAHGGNPQDRTASPRPRCIALTKDHISSHSMDIFPFGFSETFICRGVSAYFLLT
ncbi:MAG: hypothetical protein F6K65_41115 [Moorea sp. SIO3C2]|nr:hypothetical protein [Moorena sp. SIO3C2]